MPEHCNLCSLLSYTPWNPVITAQMEETTVRTEGTAAEAAGLSCEVDNSTEITQLTRITNAKRATRATVEGCLAACQCPSVPANRQLATRVTTHLPSQWPTMPHIPAPLLIYTDHYCLLLTTAALTPPQHISQSMLPLQYTLTTCLCLPIHYTVFCIYEADIANFLNTLVGRPFTSELFRSFFFLPSAL